MAVGAPGTRGGLHVRRGDCVAGDFVCGACAGVRWQFSPSPPFLIPIFSESRLIAQCEVLNEQQAHW